MSLSILSRRSPRRPAWTHGLPLALLLACTCQRGAAAAPAGFGSVVPNLTFKDIRALPRSLDDFGKPRATVLVFTTTGCPLVRRYLPRLEELSRRHASNDVQFAAVNVGPDDTIADMALQSLEQRITFPFVKDTDGSVARAVGAGRTPEVVVLDGERRLRYRGRIDDQFRVGGGKPAPGREDLARAIDDLLAGRELELKQTPVDGCAITFPPEPPATSPLTYARDIAPILNRHCVGCHRPGTEAPFSLTSHEKAAAKASSIADVVADGTMPPWYAHPSHGTFVNERRLTAAEQAALIEWCRADRKPGDLATAPPLPEFPKTKWRIGEPDLVVTALTTETLPATGYVEYRYLIFPHAFTEDTWVDGVEILPSNPRVVHHANLASVPVGKKFDQSRNFITGRVPGGNVVDLRDGRAILIPKNSLLGLQVHYVTTGKKETDRISIGLRFPRSPIKKQVRYKIVDYSRFAIPPGAAAHEVTAVKEIEHDATGIALFTHMHLRGRDSTFTAHHPDGRSETLLVMPNYNFSWQMSYLWPAGTQKFPKGTRLECRSHFDNSRFNPYNPDPGTTVRYGQQTHEEMMQGFFFYTIDDENLNIVVDPKTGQAAGQ